MPRPKGRSTLLGARTARRGSFGGVARPESAGIKPLGGRFAEPVAMGIDTFTRRDLRHRHHTNDSSVKILTGSRIVHPFEHTIKKEKIRWLTATLVTPDRHSRKTGSANSLPLDAASFQSFRSPSNPTPSLKIFLSKRRIAWHTTNHGDIFQAKSTINLIIETSSFAIQLIAEFAQRA
ncbi:hypothetical protein [Burkholderia sp. LA-2-3-30-S1-D2]|uniref:hypothetical protein n=1 Tax=Burkholderia sp. LA-2-3-30-S1-D2 TaxID=1637862 RepID=UPI00131F3779|nr:hypothetical protein [Burkholderia sp. LA-2-3-30-S1-D2]